MSLHAARQHLTTLDDLARADSPVHRLDACAKVLTTLAFVLTAVSFPPHTITSMLPLVFYPVTVATLGGVPLRALARWMLPAVPLVLLIGAANPLIDREPLLRLGRLTITGGWVSYGSIVLRLLLTVGGALLLIATTGMADICRALGRMGVPDVLTRQILLMYRYLFVLTDEAARLVRARTLRAAGRRIAVAEMGPLAGRLLLRSVDRGHRLHQAMLARGFGGSLPAGPPRATRPADVAWLAGWIALFIAARLVHLPRALGELLIWSGAA